MSSDRYGLSRVVGQQGVLPQRAQTLDPSLPCREGELLIDVESLNIDAASFKQIKDEVGAEPSRIAARVAGDRPRARQDAEPGDGLGRHAHRAGARGGPEPPGPRHAARRATASPRW